MVWQTLKGTRTRRTPGWEPLNEKNAATVQTEQTLYEDLTPTFHVFHVRNRYF